MFVFFTVVHIILCIFMIFIILLQPGKDAGMGAALGGGAATSAFGGRGAATFLTKLTAACAAGFFLTSLGLSFVGLKGSAADLIEDTTTTAPAPGTPSAVPPADMAPSTPKEAAPTPAPAGDKGSAGDAVPAEKLPAN